MKEKVWTSEALDAIASRHDRSAWDRGVAAQAYDMVEELIDNGILTMPTNHDDLLALLAAAMSQSIPAIHWQEPAAEGKRQSFRFRKILDADGTEARALTTRYSFAEGTFIRNDGPRGGKRVHTFPRNACYLACSSTMTICARNSLTSLQAACGRSSMGSRRNRLP